MHRKGKVLKDNEGYNYLPLGMSDNGNHDGAWEGVRTEECSRHYDNDDDDDGSSNGGGEAVNYNHRKGEVTFTLRQF